jgi:IS30 family transposase
VSAQPVDATPSDINLFQRIDMWGRWKEGQSLHEIGRAFGKDHVSIQFMLSLRCGIVLAVRRRSLRTLTRAEREDISRGIATGSSIRDIARSLKRAASTVSRASEADRQAWESALRPKPSLLALHSKLRKLVASKLMLDWSPEQISVWLKRQHPEDPSLRVSHETIYRSLFIQTRRALKQKLLRHLRSRRRIRRPRHAMIRGQSRGQIVRCHLCARTVG